MELWLSSEEIDRICTSSSILARTWSESDDEFTPPRRSGTCNFEQTVEHQDARLVYERNPMLQAYDIRKHRLTSPIRPIGSHSEPRL